MRTFFLIISALLFTGCTITKPSMELRVDPGPAYDSIYPYSAEICGVTQIKPLDGEPGGKHGHAALFLKGVARDESAPYPQIKLLEEGAADFSDPNSGVGVSVDKMFESVNWMAVPGRKLFFHGNLDEGQVLDAAHRKATYQKAERLGLFKGIRFREEFMTQKPSDMTESEYVASMAIGTDYALTFGRSVFCARLPMTRSMMQKSVSFLNDLNRKYAEGEKNFKWSGTRDNCAHTAHNALAAAGVWKMKSVRQFRWRILPNMAVPANEFVELAFLTGLYPLENPRKIEKNRIMKESLLNEGWIPARHGALLSILPPHEPNELYDREFTAFLVDRPIKRNKEKQIVKMIRDPRFTDLHSNLEYYEDRYKGALVKYCTPSAARKKDGFMDRYCSYLEKQLSDVRHQLKQN